MTRALLVVVAVATALSMTMAAAAAAPKLSELSGTPCGSGVCSYLAGDDDDYWDKDWHEWTDDDWDSYWDDYWDDEDNWDDEGDWAARLPAPSVDSVREMRTDAGLQRSLLIS